MTKTVTLDQYIDELDDMYAKVNEALADSIGPEVSAVMYANAVKNAPVDTGRLRQSLTEGRAIIERDDGKGEVIIGATTNIEYATYVEYGTGIKGDPSVPHVPKAFWWSLNPDWVEGMPESTKFIKWYAQSPNPFMGRALTQTEKVAMKMIKDGLDAVFE